MYLIYLVFETEICGPGSLARIGRRTEWVVHGTGAWAHNTCLLSWRIVRRVDGGGPGMARTLVV